MGSDAAGNKRRNIKRSLFAQGGQKSGKVEVSPGMQGVLVFCHRNKERQAVDELRNLFGEYVESIYGPQSNGKGSDVASTNDEEDVADSLDRELKELKDNRNKDKGQFSWCRTTLDCIAFVQTRSPIEPSEFVHKILTDLHAKKVKRTRFTARLHPVQGTCKAYIDDIKDLAKRLLAPHFHQEGQSPVKWACEPRIVFNDKIRRDELIDEIANIVGENHTVNLKQPTLTVIVDIFKSICAMSVVQNYPEFKKYNVEKIFESGQAKPDTPNQETTNTKRKPQEQSAEDSGGLAKRTKA